MRGRGPGMRGGMGRRGGMGMRRRRTTMRRRHARQQRRRMHRRRRRRRVLLGGALVVGAGALAYKLGKNDTQQIEEHTGRSVEEMSDEELEAAVNELNLRKEPLDESDQQYIDEQGSHEDDDDEPSYLDELERLAQLKDEGVITDEEFTAKKKELLGL